MHHEESPYIGNWYVLLYGVPPPSAPLTLASGVTLAPLKGPLNTFNLLAAGSAGFTAYGALDSIAHLCRCEIESAADSVTVPGYDTLNRAWLTTSLLVLRGFAMATGVACCGYSWNVIAGATQRKGILIGKVPSFKGALLDFHLQVHRPSSPARTTIEEEDAEWIRTRFDTANHLANTNASFSLALESVNDWRYAKEQRSAIARLWAGVEALFGISAELSYRVATYSAALLEKRGDDRLARYRTVRTLYGKRSRAVHGDPMGEDDLHKTMSDSYQLLHDLLIAVLDHGTTFEADDFERAVFC